MNYSTKILCFVFVLLFANFVIAQKTKKPIFKKLALNNIEREYILYIPQTIDQSKPFPLLIAMHGIGSNANTVYNSGMNTFADNNCFAVCYPNGIKKRWNVGNEAFNNGQNDVEFISLLIDEIVNNHNVNDKEVFAYGMSNGGFMCYNLACEIPEKIAAVASVTGSMTPELFKNCNPNKSISILQIHGTKDEVVPFFHAKDYSIPVKSVLNFWKTKQNCNRNIDNRKFENDCEVRKTAISEPQNCDARIKLINVKNGKHRWFCFSNQQIWYFFEEELFKIRS